MVTYDTIKQMAKDRRVSVKEFLALSEKNDPFYTGRPSEIKHAKWFARQWRELGYTSDVHLRRMHYKLVSLANVETPYDLDEEGKKVDRGKGIEPCIYQNTDGWWQYLLAAGKWARYLDYIAAQDFVDRRTPDPILNARWDDNSDHDGGYYDPTPRFGVEDDSDWSDYEVSVPTLVDLPDELQEMPRLQADGYMSLNVGDHIEVWVEKATVNDVLAPICRKHKVDLIVGKGEMSITAVLDLIKRAKRARDYSYNQDRRTIVFYISDYDPAGLGMPISVARKIEYWLTRFGLTDLDITLVPLVLTKSQVEEYSLPRVPVKDSDARKDNWQAMHGIGQVELDALEALHEGELARLVDEAISTRRADDAWWTLSSAKADLQTDLDSFASEVGERESAGDEGWTHNEVWADLENDYEFLLTEYAEIQEEWEELTGPFAERLTDIQDQLAALVQRAETAQSAFTDALDTCEIDAPEEHPLPTFELDDEPGPRLFYSQRDYMDQLRYYHRYREGISG
jgi:hypothetical protein